MIALVRVDNRLIHGQVVSTWIPHLQVQKVLVVDDEAAASSLMQAAMTLALPPGLQVEIRPSSAQADDFERMRAFCAGEEPVLVLVRDVATAAGLLEAGIPFGELNLGNVHFRQGSRPLTASLFLGADELDMLERMAAAGISIEARAVPSEHELGLGELRDRFEAAS